MINHSERGIHMKPDIEKINTVLKTVEETLDQNIKDLHSISCEEDVPDVLCSCCDRTSRASRLMHTIDPRI